MAAGLVAALGAGTGGVAHAQAAAPADDDDGEDAAGPTSEGIEGGGFDDYETAEAKKKAKVVAEYGVGVRLRSVFVPRGLLELFVEEASSGVFHPGFGLEFVRRKGTFELALGLEYENVSPDDGYWLEKGDDPTVDGQTPDFLEFDGLSWITADLTFLFHAPITEQVSFRYGAGFGLGAVLGDVLQTDSTCTGRDITEDCTKNTTGGEGVQVNDPADLPPVFPVVNLLIGAQWKPIEKLTVNLETGMRTIFFFGLSSTYFF